MARNVWKNGDKLRFNFSSCKFVLDGFSGNYGLEIWLWFYWVKWGNGNLKG